jgi:predicted HicB family RNase H-like nuclease
MQRVARERFPARNGVRSPRFVGGSFGMTEKNHEVLVVAQELYRRNPDWVTFFREVLGIGGIVRQSFPTQEQLAAFEQTQEYQQIQQLLAKLRARSSELDSSKETMRVSTVRQPQSLHESLRREAEDRQTSMNKLCISKLLQMVDDDLVPSAPREELSQSETTSA